MFQKIFNSYTLSPEKRFLDELKLLKVCDKKVFRKANWKFKVLVYPLISFLNWSKLIFVYDEVTKKRSLIIMAASMKNKAEIMLNELLTENIPQIILQYYLNTRQNPFNNWTDFQRYCFLGSIIGVFLEILSINKLYGKGSYMGASQSRNHKVLEDIVSFCKDHDGLSDITHHTF